MRYWKNENYAAFQFFIMNQQGGDKEKGGGGGENVPI